MEVWKDIPGYEGYYQASTLGNIRSVPRVTSNNHYKEGKVLKQRPDKNGYSIVCLCKDGERKFRKVHRLVAMTFIPNPCNLPQVNHKDEVKANNDVFNLEWCTAKYNTNYGLCIERISKAQKGVPNPRCQGERNYFYGKHFSRGLHPQAKKISQYDLDGNLIKTYDCMNDAAEAVGACHSSISLVCTGKNKTCKGYKWAYAS